MQISGGWLGYADALWLLVGLATPLFTQVIIDKVVVHQTHSTLIVLGIGLVMFMLFTSGMSWLRQYLVLHTGNRIAPPVSRPSRSATPTTSSAMASNR